MDINEYVPTALIMGILQCDQIGPFLQVLRSKVTYLFGDFLLLLSAHSDIGLLQSQSYYGKKSYHGKRDSK